MSVGKKPRKRIPRYTELQPSGRIKSKPRTKAESRRIYGTDAHQKWLRDHPCLGCARIGTDERPHHLHHVENGGMGKKADAALQVPLCDSCHAFVHDHGRKTFEAAYWRMLAGRTLAEWAAKYAAAWPKFQSQPEPLSSVVPRVVAALRYGSDD